ncbi:MAG TPA: glycoside hydrolase 100 family protein, partial [Sedimentisphaerales bacterium]|nr:glycoside hydrolase 100 family protein [Sedimentisphaerales bacterium]
NRQLVAQLPTSDWRDEQWVLGYGLFVNTVVYTYLCVLGQYERASMVRKEMENFTITGDRQHGHVHEGLLLKNKPYYALWSYKIYQSERFDLLGNSLAILSGIACETRARKIITWVEKECHGLRENGSLAVDMAPNFFPYIKQSDPDWIDRYEKYNQPGKYHNGGIWPFVCGFYIAALVAAGRYKLAEKKLLVLTELVKKTRAADVEFGFNEWLQAQDANPQGQDWQTWSAAMYLYAAECVQQRKTPFFNEIREKK